MELSNSTVGHKLRTPWLKTKIFSTPKSNFTLIINQVIIKMLCFQTPEAKLTSEEYVHFVFQLLTKCSSRIWELIQSRLSNIWIWAFNVTSRKRSVLHKVYKVLLVMLDWEIKRFFLLRKCTSTLLS